MNSEHDFRPWQSILAGVAIGWLVGLSSSPVVGIVISGAVTLLVPFTSSVSEKLAGKLPRAGSATAFAMYLSGGIAMGAPIGLFFKSNAIFGPSPELLAKRWSGPLLQPDMVRTQLFAYVFGDSGTSTGAPAKHEDKGNKSEKSFGLLNTDGNSLAALTLATTADDIRPVISAMTSNRFEQFLTNLNEGQTRQLRAMILFLNRTNN